MDSSHLYDRNGEYDSVRDRTYVTSSAPRQQGPQALAGGSMQVESLTVRSSPKNAATGLVLPPSSATESEILTVMLARMMYDLPSQALDKAMDGVLNDEPTPPIKATGKRGKKEKKLNLNVPGYGKEPGEYFLYLVNEVRYEKFAKDVQALNPESVKRSDMEILCRSLVAISFSPCCHENFWRHICYMRSST